jgi:uncharacterized protein
MNHHSDCHDHQSGLVVTDQAFFDTASINIYNLGVTHFTAGKTVSRFMRSIIMSKIIQIKTGGISLEAVLNETKTAEAIWKALPITGSVNTWGDEIYFDIPVKAGEEKGQEIVQPGELGYWPPGSAFCIFFGPTPMSRGKEIRPASPVNVFGKVSGDATVLKQVRDGAKISIEKKP